MNLKQFLPTFLMLVGCAESPEEASTRYRTVYQSGDLTIREINANSRRVISVVRGNDRLAVITQKSRTNDYFTSSVSAWTENGYYGVYSDDDDDGWFETLLIQNPLEDNNFKLYDISRENGIVLSSQEKHRQTAEMYNLMTEFWSKFHTFESVDELIEEAEILKKTVEEIANKAVEGSPTTP